MLTCSKCRASVRRGEEHTAPVFGLNRTPRVYCSKCWHKVEWAKAHSSNKSRAASRSRDVSRAEAEERANARYWERVDAYRENGYYEP